MTGEPRTLNGVKIVSLISDVGKTRYPHSKELNFVHSLSFAIYKNLLKMDKRLKCKTLNHKTPGGKHRGKFLDIGLGIDFFYFYF